MLTALKEAPPQSHAKASTDLKEAVKVQTASEEGKQGDAEERLRAQVRELSEKLAFAHETIAIMEEEHRRQTAGTTAEQPSQEPDDLDDVADKTSEGSNPSAKMVDRMISRANKRVIGRGLSDV